MNNEPFIPIIVGTDMNAYNMAISFHEEYNIKPILVGKEEMSFTKWSSVIDHIEIHPNLWDKAAFVTVLTEVAMKYKTAGKQLLLIGTNDFYVRLIIENAKALKEMYVFNYMSEELMNNLLVKSNFYKLCEEHGIDAPKTYYYSCAKKEPFTEEVLFPLIIKPSNGVQYYKNKFPGQQKVYRVESHEELNNVINKVNASGYKEDLIIQDYIPGDDTYMWDSVFYMNSKGKAQLSTFAQVVLQEHTVTAIGNYTALITRYNEELMLKLQHFLEAVGYVGFANFDLKYDERDGKFKVFEVNIRQGRSSYYTTALGHNMARYFVDDVIYNKAKPLTLLDEHYLFTVVPKIVLKKFVDNKEIQREIRHLLRTGKWGNPMFYKKDTSFMRKLYLIARQFNYYKKYKNNNW
ncbi:carboxylate--amine ligase [Psychrobacillus lasiicapitis]|uniref:Carboxylate--amine ligase n=1 Tax=Psychrobacillus lasiicapitis TaxID=1636719 RepID=A0A544T903_9BACI|nr:carboxylate--amine ligase [Psychrobacillus lasiicapitis]TQR13942.1 carboxylate--amine ligase [Psychrobacillus lasiicapitis]GGA36821.1 carboxylate--amine ligase [Psychrobacillus lasiicapitis]